MKELFYYCKCKNYKLKFVYVDERIQLMIYDKNGDQLYQIEVSSKIITYSQIIESAKAGIPDFEMVMPIARHMICDKYQYDELADKELRIRHECKLQVKQQSEN